MFKLIDLIGLASSILSIILSIMRNIYTGGGHGGNPFGILAWRNPWTEEPGGLMGSQRVGHD